MCQRQSLSKQLTWEICKSKIKNFTIRYSKMKSKCKKALLSSLETNLQNIEDKMNNDDQLKFKKEYAEAKGKVEKMYKDLTQGAIIRSRVKWYEEGESNTRYFCGLEKHRAAKNSMTVLKSHNGKKVTKTNDILKECVHYYSNLYQSKNVEDEIIDRYVNETVHGLSNDDKKVCEGLL